MYLQMLSDWMEENIMAGIIYQISFVSARQTLI